MVAFRVALSLVVVLLLTPPAFAQFSTEDVNGLWTVHATRVAVRQGADAGWLQGSVLFSRNGAVLDDEVRDQGETLVALRPGAVGVSPNGEVVGVLGNASVQGRFLSDKNQIVGVATADAGTPDETNTFFVLVRTPTSEFSQADATGTWRLDTLLVPAPPTTTPEYVLGHIVVGDDGTITGGQLTSSDGSTTTSTGGTLLVNTDGTFTGRLDIGPFGNDHTAFSGTFAAGRGLMVGAASRSLPNEEERNGMLVLQREPTINYLPTDAAGTWALFGVQAQSDSPVGMWLRGTLVADAFGVVTGGTLTDGLGNSVVVEGGFIGITGGGSVLAEILVDSNFDLILLQGSMLPSKAQIFAVEDRVGGDLLFSGLVTMIKTTAVPPPPAATVQFSQPSYTVNEGVANAVITATRTGAVNVPFTVPFSATPGTALPDQDFKTVATTLTFAANVASRTVNVPIVNNTVVDGNRSVLLTLGAPTGNVALGSPATATLIIQDNDLPGTFKVDKGTYTVLESAGTLSIIVRRTGTSLAGNVSVAYTTIDGTATSEGTPRDYTSTNGRLTFNVNETMKTVSIPILKDNLVDGDKTFTFVLSDPSSGATLDPNLSSALVTIKDVDVGGQIKFAPAIYSVNEGAGQVRLTVVRSGGTAGGVLVDFTLVSGTATVSGSGTLTFGVGNTSATITLFVNQDSLVEGNETFQVQLSNPRGVVPCVVCNSATLPGLVAPMIATVTIVDDESAFQFGAPTFTVTEGTAHAVINVLRTGSLAGTTTVAYTATPGTAVAGRDFTQVSGILTFPANTPSKTFNVPILNNALLDGNRSVMLALANPTGGAQLGTVNTATLTIVDNDQAGQFKLDKTAYTVAENAGFVTITVMRAGTNLVGNVSVTLTATNGTATSGVNYTAPTGALTFAAGETAKIVKIPITPDHVVTGPLAFTVALINPSGGATLGTPATAPVTITNTDLGGQISFAPATYLVAESAGSVTLVVRRTGGLAGNVSVGFTTAVIVPASPSRATSDDFTAVEGRLTFGFGNTSATIVIPITRDEGIEPNESFQVKLFDAQGGATLPGPSVATVTIADLDPVVQFSGKFLGNFPQVVRTGSLATEVTVEFVATDVTATAGSDYLLADGTLTFKPNVAVQYIPLTIIGDNIAEGSETFKITLGNPTAPARLGPDSVRVFAIADNDFGGNVGFEAMLYGVTEGGTVEVAVVRTGGVGTVLTVQWQAGPGSATPCVNFMPASGSVTFGPNDKRQTFTITALTDLITKDPETVALTLSVPVGAATLGRATTTLRILDSPPVVEEGSKRAP